MKLVKYTEDQRDLLMQFELNEEQLKYVKGPKENINMAEVDNNRIPIFGRIDEGIPVIFFVLHEHSEYEHEFDVDNSIYVRSFATDHRYLRQGYAKAALLALPEFLQQHFSHVEYITLLVDVPNEAARAMYSKLGFKQGKRIEGERYPAYCMIKKIKSVGHKS